MKFESFPYIIGIELTLACNLHCRHCASSAGKPREDELSFDELTQIINQFPFLLVQEVDLTGGEPLLHPYWDRIARLLSNLNIPVRMVSNGILLNENIAKIKDSGIQTIGISIDGLEETHDHIRERPGLFKFIISGIETALKTDIPVAAITAVNNYNIDELPGIMEFLIKIGISHWQLQPTFSLGRAREKNMAMVKKTFINLGKFIKDVLNNEQDKIMILPADGVGYFSELDTREETWNGCGAGKISCGITSNGNIKGCLSMSDNLIEGNLRERDLWSIWFDENSFSYNRQFSLDDLGESCRGCKYGLQCMGGCAVMSYSATSKFHNNPLCFHGILHHHS